MSERSSFFDEERDAYVFGVLRVAAGALVVTQTTRSLLTTFRQGYFGDLFHLPLVPEALVPSLSVYLVLQAVALAGGVLAVLGVHGRVGLLSSALAGLFLLLANRLDYHNNRFALLLLAFLTAFTPCDRSFLLLRWIRGHGSTLAERERLGPVLPARLVGLTVSAIYVSSGGGKLLDADWRGGQTMLVRFGRSIALLTERFGELPEPLVTLYSSPALASVASKAAITLELALAVALWLPRTRALALYAGALFHLNIELAARVELFSYVMAAAYVAFVVPELRERVVELDPATRAGHFVKRALPLVDWLARFRVEERTGAGVVVRARGGTEHRGAAAVAELARAIPVLFPLWGPLALAARFARKPRV